MFLRANEPVISFGANLAKVSIDRETGNAMVNQCVAYYDAGRVLDSSAAIGQSIGGSAQGIAQVLYEEERYDKEGGELTTGSIEDAGVPTATLIPDIEIQLAIHPSVAEEPIKGIGEASTTGVPPAVVRALEKSVGKRIRKTPIKPHEILELFQEEVFSRNSKQDNLQTISKTSPLGKLVASP